MDGGLAAEQRVWIKATKSPRRFVIPDPGTARIWSAGCAMRPFALEGPHRPAAGHGRTVRARGRKTAIIGTAFFPDADLKVFLDRLVQSVAKGGRALDSGASGDFHHGFAPLTAEGQI